MFYKWVRSAENGISKQADLVTFRGIHLFSDCFSTFRLRHLFCLNLPDDANCDGKWGKHSGLFYFWLADLNLYCMNLPQLKVNFRWRRLGSLDNQLTWRMHVTPKVCPVNNWGQCSGIIRLRATSTSWKPVHSAKVRWWRPPSASIIKTER